MSEMSREMQRAFLRGFHLAEGLYYYPRPVSAPDARKVERDGYEAYASGRDAVDALIDYEDRGGQ